MTLTRHIYALIFVLISGFVLGQTVLPKNELDDKYTPNASSMFNNLVKKAYDENAYVEIEFKNVARFCPTMLIREKVFFAYERTLYKGLVGVAGIGKAFGKDVLQNSYFAIFSNSDNNILNPNQGTIGTYLGSMPLLHAGIKIYFSGTAFEDAFFELNYRRERMDYLLPPIVNGNSVDGENDIQFKMNAFSIGFGFTSVGGEKSNIVHDFYINFGLKSFNYNQYDLVSVINPVNAKLENFYRKSDTYAKTRIVPSLNIGYAFGFGW